MMVYPGDVMLLPVLLGAALMASAPVHQIQNVITPNQSYSGSSSSDGGSVHVGGGSSLDNTSQSDRDQAMQLYSSVGSQATDTALNAFQAAAQAESRGAGNLAQHEMQIARHGVANVAIAKAELISGSATNNHPRNSEAAVAEFHEKMQQEESSARAQAESAQDSAHKQFFAAMLEYLTRIEGNPGLYSRRNGADLLGGR
jgi:hypothetical protein